MSIDITKSTTIDENDMAYEFFNLDKEPEVSQTTNEPDTQEEGSEIKQNDLPNESLKEPENNNQQITNSNTIEEPPIDPVIPDYNGKKYIPIDNEKELFEKLSKKYTHETMKPEEKALAFIKLNNPELDDNELLFIAESDYGIGVERPNEDELSDAQLLELKKQDISRKKLLKQADSYFKEEAEKIQLTAENPLEFDDNYKNYIIETKKQADTIKEQEKIYQETLTQITSASNKISDLKIPVEIDIDDSKLAIDVNFKMDKKKQNELVNYAKRYEPSTEEIAQFTDQSTGKFDFDGYMSELANKLFAKDIIKAGIRQALYKDREEFKEKELKNSTLRNNDISQISDQKEDFNSVYWSKYAGT